MTDGGGWLGRLSLELRKTAHGTQLSRSSHEGPLRIQRVLKPEGNDCPHIYLLHPPGGVVGGDRLHTTVDLGPEAQVLLTTPAAQKLYRSQGARAEVSSLLRLDRGARLEWLPSETLAFSAAQALLTTRVELETDAAFLGWDIACYGMPARGETFDAGRAVSRFELFRRGAPLVIDSFDLGDAPGRNEPGGAAGNAELLRGAFALRGQPVVANLYAVPAHGAIEPGLVDRVRDAIGEPARGLCSVSSLQDLLVVRALGPNVEGVRDSLIRAWQVLRPAIVARAAVTPRIWAT